MKQSIPLILLATLLVSGCVSPECVEASDCTEKQADIMCTGEWDCIEGTCVFQCTTIEPEPECANATDCQDREPPVECTSGTGEWNCDNGNCNYTCTPEPTPKENESEPPELQILSFSAEGSSYGSNEMAVFMLSVNSSQKIKNVQVLLKGVKPYNNYYMEASETYALTNDLNELSIGAQTPHCTSGCGGVKPGDYDVTVEIKINGELKASATTTINLHS